MLTILASGDWRIFPSVLGILIVGPTMIVGVIPWMIRCLVRH